MGAIYGTNLPNLGRGKAFLSKTEAGKCVKEALWRTDNVGKDTINRFQTLTSGWETTVTTFITGKALISTRDKVP